MKYHPHGCLLAFHADFSKLTAGGSEARWGAEGAEVGLPRSTLCQEATGSRKLQSVYVMGRWSGAEGRQRCHMGAGTGEVRSPEDQHQGWGPFG